MFTTYHANYNFFTDVTIHKTVALNAHVFALHRTVSAFPRVNLYSCGLYEGK